MKPALKLVANPDPRRRLIAIFKARFREVTGEEDPVTWSAAMRSMNHFRWVDEQTGEEIVDYPTESAWEKELGGYWDNEWARDKMGYSFFFFIKHFGKFGNYKRQARKAQLTQYTDCPNCLRSIPVGGDCSHCREVGHD